MIFTPFTIGFTVIAVVLAVGYAVVMEGEAIEPLYVTKYEPQLIELDRRVVEAAYVQHVTALFLGWMKDGSGQPERAVRGANQARRAYTASMDAIEERVKNADVRHK